MQEALCLFMLVALRLAVYQDASALTLFICEQAVVISRGRKVIEQYSWDRGMILN